MYKLLMCIKQKVISWTKYDILIILVDVIYHNFFATPVLIRNNTKKKYEWKINIKKQKLNKNFITKNINHVQEIISKNLLK